MKAAAKTVAKSKSSKRSKGSKLSMAELKQIKGISVQFMGDVNHHTNYAIREVE